jgi:hypothetical protein
MGHLNCLAESPEAAFELAHQARSALAPSAFTPA